MIFASVVLSFLISISVNAGIHVYKKDKVKKEITVMEKKYKVLINNCYLDFMILYKEVEKDRVRLLGN